ncbi:MAG: bifunctional riboflavin kinase/FAD synthetase [Clostridiales Family XIII bacterium]|jgi:riboflavin kinase/FMN adenylyltransferase|nr:bifunctional riboflavin kinase/FAD synthetase [Clostridiales Family XIII bacterium]
MIEFTSLTSIGDIGPTAVALGNFDGIHRGHHALISRTAAYAQAHGLKTAVFTFSNHPRNFIAGKQVVKSLLTPTEKKNIIKNLGADYLFNLPFDETCTGMEPEVFIRDLLLGHFKAEAVFCGFNFHFGKKAAGNTLVLEQAAEREGFKLVVLEPYIVDDVLVSSTEVRKAISAGEMGLCRKYLGRPYALTGEAVPGNKLGRKLGFATANVVLPEDMMKPAYAIYVTGAVLEDGIERPAISNVGVRPTIGDHKELIETHIFDYDGVLYGKRIRTVFYERIRYEMKFDGVDAMKAQVERDILTARSWWAKR